MATVISLISLKMSLSVFRLVREIVLCLFVPSPHFLIAAGKRQDRTFCYLKFRLENYDESQYSLKLKKKKGKIVDEKGQPPNLFVCRILQG